MKRDGLYSRSQMLETELRSDEHIKLYGQKRIAECRILADKISELENSISDQYQNLRPIEQELLNRKNY